MKKLFTFCATALLAFTVSAQADQAKGSFYVGVTDATELFNIVGDEEMDLTLSFGYAVQDGLVVLASMHQDTYTDSLGTHDYADQTINLGLRYFKNGFYGQINLNDFRDATGLNPEATLSVGSLYSLDLVDGLYVDPSITLGRENDETEMSFNIGVGVKF
jgi:hypothetical protein